MKNGTKQGGDSITGGFKWRGIGPPRGGRVVAVAGDPADPMTFYFGACAGGIWKTTDGGTYWECVSDGYLTSATIGALAVSDSDPNVIYAGTVRPRFASMSLLATASTSRPMAVKVGFTWALRRLAI